MLTNFFQSFQFPTAEAVFLATGNWVFIKSFITTSGYRLWVNSKPCAFIRFFAAAGKDYWNLVLTSFLRFFKFLTVEAVFLASGDWVFIKSFIRSSVYRFWVKFKPCAFIQLFFFCCWKVLLKLGVNQFSSIFSIPNSGRRVFIKFLMATSVYRFLVFSNRAFLLRCFSSDAGKHYWN